MLIIIQFNFPSKMAIAIKPVPTLKGKHASSFLTKIDANVKSLSKNDFSNQIKSAENILAKAKLK